MLATPFLLGTGQARLSLTWSEVGDAKS